MVYGDFMQKFYIGSASDLGVHIDGTSFGPEALFNSTNFQNVKIYKMNHLYGKSKCSKDRCKNFNELYAYLYNLYVNIINLPSQDLVLNVGGDHSVAIASALAANAKKGPLGLIWIDAHTDYHTLSSTTSGNLHGLPCAMINGYGARNLAYFHKGDFISSANTVIVGARSIDQGEYENLSHTKAKVITMEEVFARGIEDVMAEAFAIAGNGTNGVHLSYDLDFLDPNVAPGVSTPVAGGGTFQMYESLLKIMNSYHRAIYSFDLVEFNPLKDIDCRTKELAARILLNF